MMTNITKQHVFFVDDESKVCKIVGRTLEQVGLKVSCFTSAAECLKQLRFRTCDLLITDVKMPEMDGIELLKKVRQFAPWLPVLVITGYDDIPTAVTAIKTGAVDFIKKPLVKKSIISKVKSILQQSTFDDSYIGKPLTKSETKVLKLIIDGKSNKEIAHLLYRSKRTIELHRGHLMHKLGVNNLVGLVKRAMMIGLVELPIKKTNQGRLKGGRTP